MFAATLACVIAASRVLLLMAHHGLAPRTPHPHQHHPRNSGEASILAAVLAFLPAAGLVLHGTSGADIYGWMGTLAVYGFLTAYGLVAVALAFHLRHSHRLTSATSYLTSVATLAMLLAMASNFYPIPPAPLRYFPYLYAAYLGASPSGSADQPPCHPEIRPASMLTPSTLRLISKPSDPGNVANLRPLPRKPRRT